VSDCATLSPSSDAASVYCQPEPIVATIATIVPSTRRAFLDIMARFLESASSGQRYVPSGVRSAGRLTHLT